MVTNHSTILYQVHGLANKFQVENSRDQTQVLMMKPFLARGDPISLEDPSMFQRRPQSMVTNHFIILFQDHGLANKFQEENLRDQTQVLMMKPFLARRDHSLLKDLSMFQRRLQSMVTSHCTIPSQDHGLVNKSQEENSRDPIPVLTMKLS